MKGNNAIEVNNISKSFRVFQDRSYTLMETLLFWKRKQFEKRNVLKDISFEVDKGEAIGLIGSNGSGKSTILKLLSKILYPDSGSIKIAGRVSSLIELGAGFHPDMTGRENIYINASIFGLTKKEIDARVDEIITFSELENFIDEPVRVYSSGMYMRLAFSVAINVDADILLIDEILAVGDAGFQAKCLSKLKEKKANGTTIVIVSHSLTQIEQICERSIWIHDGKVRLEGAPREVHPLYMEYMAEKQRQITEKQLNTHNVNENNESQKNSLRWGNGKGKIVSVEMIHEKNTHKGFCFSTGESVRIIIHYVLDEQIEDAAVGIGIFRNDGVNCYGTNTRLDRIRKFSVGGEGTIEMNIKHISLLAGKYSLDVAISDSEGIPVDYWRESCLFEIVSEIEDVGVSRLWHDWVIE